MARSQEHGLAHARLSPTNSPEEGEATCTATWLGRQQCSSPLLPELGFGAAGPTSSVFLALGSGQAPSFTLAGLAEQPGPSLCTWWKPPPPRPPAALLYISVSSEAKKQTCVLALGELRVFPCTRLRGSPGHTCRWRERKSHWTLL